MNRREVLKTTLAASGALALAAHAPARATRGAPFHLKYAPHFGMFRRRPATISWTSSSSPPTRASRAWEDNGMKAPGRGQERIGKTMERARHHDGRVRRARPISGR